MNSPLHKMMKEDFLAYVWKFQKFKRGEFITTCGLPLKIFSPGQQNFNSGPDFFNAKLTIDDQLWAGNVEIHVKSSQWYQHSHQNDSNYDTVVLHVVWEHDTDVYRIDNTTIPTLEIKNIVHQESLVRYRNLFSNKHDWIQCERVFSDVPSIVITNWFERLYIERLQQQTIFIKQEFLEVNKHWEALLFRLLCKNFGMKVNSDSFLSISRSVDFSVIKKCCSEKRTLEALLLGQAGLLKGEKDSNYFVELQKEYFFIRHKFNLINDGVICPKFFRLRPSNFPTIRLSQLAELYRLKGNIFSEVIMAKTKQDIYKIFDVRASEYWDMHYNFGNSNIKHTKKLTKNFMDLIIINTIVPLQFYYRQYYQIEGVESCLQLMASVQKEENSIVRKFNKLGLNISSALESQALIHLKSNYCSLSRCLDCSIGNSIIKGCNK